MGDRRLDITKFSYKSYRILKKRLGEFDAVVECNEIAIREFLERANSTSYSLNKYIQELSDKHDDIYVDSVNSNKFSLRIRQYFIVSVSQQFEQFLQDFKNEFLIYFNEESKWIEKRDGEILLDNILRNITNQTTLPLPNTISSDLILCYNYYRLIRNFMAHTDRDKRKIERIHSKIHNNENNFKEELGLDSLPNELEKIDFSDFILFTNIVKHLAYNMSVKSKPDNDRIANILFNMPKNNNHSSFQGIKKLKNNDTRYLSAIKNHLKTHFGRFCSSDSEEIADKFKSLLA